MANIVQKFSDVVASQKEGWNGQWPIRNTVTAAFGSLALLSAAVALPAHADDAPEAVPVALNEVVVPYDDARGIGLEGVQLAAAIASKDGTSVVYYGTNYEFYQALTDGLRQTVAEDEVPLEIFMLADPQLAPDLGQSELVYLEVLEVYGHGVQSERISNPDISDGLNIGDYMKDAFRPEYSQEGPATPGRG